MINTSLLRPTWQRIFGQAWILNLVLWLALGGLRAYGLLGPAGARMLVMVGLSWLFTLCRQRSGSIWPAVAAHSAFNLVMNVCIFGALM